MLLRNLIDVSGQDLGSQAIRFGDVKHLFVRTDDEKSPAIISCYASTKVKDLEFQSKRPSAIRTTHASSSIFGKVPFLVTEEPCLIPSR